MRLAESATMSNFERWSCGRFGDLPFFAVSFTTSEKILTPRNSNPNSSAHAVHLPTPPAKQAEVPHQGVRAGDGCDQGVFLR